MCVYEKIIVALVVMLAFLGFINIVCWIYFKINKDRWRNNFTKKGY